MKRGLFPLFLLYRNTPITKKEDMGMRNHQGDHQPIRLPCTIHDNLPLKILNLNERGQRRYRPQRLFLRHLQQTSLQVVDNHDRRDRKLG